MKNIYIGLCLLFCGACGKINDEYIDRSTGYAVDWTSAADSSSSSFVSVFWNPTKHHFNNDNLGTVMQYDYWPEAHGLDAMIDAYSRTKSDVYKTKIYDFYEGVKAKNGGRFYNNYYDDMGWHGMAHMRALEATGDTRYETSSRQLWEWITVGWNNEDGGGIPWNHENTTEGRSKGVPSNGPAAIIAARRWQKYGDAEVVNGHNNLEWLSMIYNWIKENRVVQQSGRVFENINDSRGDWTYNAGTYMGAALEYYKITGNKVYLNDAIKTADWTTSTLINTNNKVLSDWAEQQDHDVNLFKGIFVRYLTNLIRNPDLPETNRKRYVSFLKNSAQVLWTQGTLKTPVILFGYHWWEAPLEPKVALRTEISGATLMEALALLKSEGYLDK
ncbi:MAG: glycoside hydrolase family 76 protein [Candidatus Pseudobacter hemicellulosilyticus]|uniref:Glycoside hydrolase family 76 protein n=1 Tax=Candidatus Pseudobacter hemicellulosilyticus TaxID=3121375 RepID=A0AAJ6BEE9_9BACT|nr:MAG: glycoside hydrolase family 76 protein [Pseudobacter sp.]